MSQSVVFEANNPNTTLPSFLYIDTNSIAEIGYNRKYQNSASNVLIKASQNDTFLILSKHTKDELLDVTQVEVLKEEVKINGFTGNPMLSGTPIWKQYENTGVNVGTKVIARYNQVIAMIQSLAPTNLYEVNNPPDEIFTTLTHKYVNSGMPTKDARHAAIMNYYETNDILTLDEGFMRAPDLNVYAVNYKLLRHLVPGSQPNAFKPMK